MNILVLTLVLFQAPAVSAGDTCEALLTEKAKIYGYKPTALNDEQQKQKSDMMDEFWKLAESQGPAGVECINIKKMLREEKTDGFFLFDGAALLANLDESDASTAVVLDALERSDLDEVDKAGYIGFVLHLSRRGVAVGPLAYKYLVHPEVVTYLPAHGGMELDRMGGGIILFGTIEPAQADRHLKAGLASTNPELREVSAKLLALNLTEESFKTLRSLGEMENYSKETKEYVQTSMKRAPAPSIAETKFSRQEVLKILRRIPHTKEEHDALMPEYEKYEEQRRAQRSDEKLSDDERYEQMMRDIEESEPFFDISGAKRFEESAVNTLTEADLDFVREARRKAVQGVSDETLYEYMDYTRIILGMINRLDLYKEYRME